MYKGKSSKDGLYPVVSTAGSLALADKSLTAQTGSFTPFCAASFVSHLSNVELWHLRLGHSSPNILHKSLNHNCIAYDSKLSSRECVRIVCKDND